MTGQTRHMICYLIWRVWLVICRYRISILSYDVIWRHMTILNFLSQYILVYTSTWIYMSGTVYHGISRHMTAYRISGKVHASIDWYILVHMCTFVYIHFLLFCSLLHPADPPESCEPTSAKRHPFQVTTSLFFYAVLWLLLAAAQPAGERGGGGASQPPPPPPVQSLNSAVVYEPERSNKNRFRWENKLNHIGAVVYSHSWRVLVLICVD